MKTMANRIVLAVMLSLTVISAKAADEKELVPTPEHPLGWRNDGTGHYPGVTPPTVWSQTQADGAYASKNIAWKVRLPSHGASSPIVIGDKIYIIGGGDHSDSPMDILCLDRGDGKVLWIKTLTYYHTVSDAERKMLTTLRVDFDAARYKNIFLLANRKLSDGAMAESNYEVSGAKVVKAELLGTGGQVVKLTLAEPLTNGQTLAIGLKGVKTEDGQVADAQTKGTVLPGKPVTRELICDFLVGGLINGKQGTGAQLQETDPIDETTVKPAAGAVWKPLRNKCGIIDLTRVLGERHIYGSAATAYSCVYLYSETSQDVQFWFGNTCGIHVVVNGAKVHRAVDANRNLRPDQDKIKNIMLKQGWNQVVIKHAIGWMGAVWSYTLRVMDKDGAAPPCGVYYSLDGGNNADLTEIYANLPMLPDFAAVEATAKPLMDKLEAMNNELVAKVNAVSATTKTTLYPTQFPIQLPAWPRMNHPALPQAIAAEVAFNKARNDLTQKLNKLCFEYDPTHYKPLGINEFGCASGTPCSDGKNIYVYFANRIAACFDLDGNCQWAKLYPVNGVAGGGHGTHWSPLLAGGVLVLSGWDFLACDSSSGDFLWNGEVQKLGQSEEGGVTTPILAKSGKEAAVVVATGQGVNLATGRVAWCRQPANAISPTSPVVQDDTIFVFQNTGMYTAPIPTAFGEATKLELKVSIKRKDVIDHPIEGGNISYRGEKGYEKDATDLYATASPLVVGDLLYCVSGYGVLFVIDIKENKIVYARTLDVPVVWPGLSASPALAGGNIYILSSEGTTLILKPGRAYQEVGHNTIESLYNEKGHREKFLATPIFAGKQLFLRGEQYLYCIGE